ncbi:hypothetical protein SEA_LILYPAD_75 [Gordonia phage LilyPad]|nr:hypothetical protein SEA_LILYPAD_75 [Gordonia phage LilyPad]
MIDETPVSQQEEGATPPSVAREARQALEALRQFSEALRAGTQDLRLRVGAQATQQHYNAAARPLTPVERAAKRNKRKASKAARKNSRKGKK